MHDSTHVKNSYKNDKIAVAPYLEDIKPITTSSTSEKSDDDQCQYLDYEPPPDGGWFAWTQAALCHLVMLNTWGIVNSFGAFQNYYHTELLIGYNSSSISWIGSIQVFLLFFVGAFTGHFSDKGFFRHLIFIGSFLLVAGMLMTSFAASYWQLLLSQGICLGLGNGFLFCPSLIHLSTYFSSKKGIAMGICAAGSANGGMIYSTLFSRLLPTIGFAWTIRTAAFIQFVCLIICNIGLRPRVLPKKSSEFIDWESFYDTPYVLFTFGIFFNLWGVYFASHYISLFATAILGLPFRDSSNILILLNGVGLIGRTLPNILADYYVGSLNSLIIMSILSAMMSFCWISVNNRIGLYVWAAFYGIFNAAIQSLYPASLSNLTKDISKMGTRMGMVLTFVSVTALTGAPIAGELIRVQDGKYMYAQLFSGLSIMVGSGLLISARLVENRRFIAKL